MIDNRKKSFKNIIKAVNHVLKLVLRSIKLKNTVYFKRFTFLSIHVAATLDFVVSKIGTIAPLLLLLDHFGAIRNTIKLTVATAGIEKKFIKKTHEVPQE